MQPAAVVASGVHFGYGTSPVLRGVDLAIAPGEFVALVGSNGSGKSTLLRVLLGLLAPSQGSVSIQGAVGYVPQRPAMADELPATVAEVVAAGALSRQSWWWPKSRPSRSAVDKALSEVGLSQQRGSELRHLSGGQRQRAFIAKALVAEPQLLILDEPVAGVDVESQQRFRDTLVHMQREHGVTVLLVSHELGAVEQDLDRVAVLSGGRITFDGSPEELVRAGVSLGVHRGDLPVWLEDRG